MVRIKYVLTFITQALLDRQSMKKCILSGFICIRDSLQAILAMYKSFLPPSIPTTLGVNSVNIRNQAEVTNEVTAEWLQ